MALNCDCVGASSRIIKNESVWSWWGRKSLVFGVAALRSTCKSCNITTIQQTPAAAALAILPTESHSTALQMVVQLEHRRICSPPNPSHVHPHRCHEKHHHLSVSLQVERVVPLPRLPPACRRLGVRVTLAETARLLAGGRQASGLAVLVHRVHDPVDARITADGLVLGVDEDDLVVLVGRILVDPV